ncbi:MAG: N-acetylmuramoyl-L-alanine amidase [Planctomycetes bacterium]|nr:N-acetylmuramoyl-L-alanine amidase [Planctomycetota bacterium]
MPAESVRTSTPTRADRYLRLKVTAMVLGILVCMFSWNRLSHFPQSKAQAIHSSSGWMPPSRQEDKNRWEGIVVHHSGARSGNAKIIDAGHKQKNWNGLGYHFVIDNGQGGPDGLVEVGYRWQEQKTGAHCRKKQGDDNYWNKHTIGICLVGNFEQHDPTAAQYETLAELIHFLQVRYDIPDDMVMGHNDVRATACPGRRFSWGHLQQHLELQ